MALSHHYIDTIDTMYPDGHRRETLFRDSGEMLSPAPALVPARSGLAQVLRRIQLWRSKRAGRLALRELSDEQLRDIGVSAEEARKEVAKSSFWI